MASRKDKRPVLKHDDPKPGIVGRKDDFVATNATQRKWLADATSVGEKNAQAAGSLKLGQCGASRRSDYSACQGRTAVVN